MHAIAAKAVAFAEALTPEFREYTDRVVHNAQVLADRLAAHGYDVVGGGTDTHLILIDLRNTELTGKDAEALLGRAEITVTRIRFRSKLVLLLSLRVFAWGQQQSRLDQWVKMRCLSLQT